MLAVDVEESNGSRLRTLAELFADYAPDAAALFSEMADEEDLHAEQLKVAFERRFGELGQAVAESSVNVVVEAHDLDDGEHMVFDDIDLRRALEIVLKAEKHAEAFYRGALDAATDPELGELYRQLAEFEDGHVQWIEARLASLGDSA
jgi:rubrerythrin